MTDDELLYEYTDEMAVTDGVLVDIESLGVDLNGKPVNRMTSNLLAQVCPKKPDGSYDLDKMQTQLFMGTAIAHDEEGDGFLLASKLPQFEREVWFVSNEIGGYTLMLPEDY